MTSPFILMRSAPSELFEQAAKVATDNKVMAPANNFFFMFTPFYTLDKCLPYLFY